MTEQHKTCFDFFQIFCCINMSMMYTAALFNKYPPPPEIELEREEIGELQDLLMDKPISTALPEPEDLKLWGLESPEQYAIYDAYVTWRYC